MNINKISKKFKDIYFYFFYIFQLLNDTTEL